MTDRWTDAWMNRRMEKTCCSRTPYQRESDVASLAELRLMAYEEIV